MERFSLSEPIYAIGRFETNKRITIEVYNMTTNTKETLNSDICTEIGQTGVYMWKFNDNLSSFSTITNGTKTSAIVPYYYVMKNSYGDIQEEWVMLGGYAEDSARGRKALWNDKILTDINWNGLDIREVTYDDDGITQIRDQTISLNGNTQTRTET